ncbi:MAG: HAMP domain-containing protein [Prolixibacteraceae bacterium]|jgi:methyl-accepting chemotaxis protein
MKISVRTRFMLGMLFFFIVIAGISILSAYHMNRLSNKTDAILKENHFSVIFARDMSDGLTQLNQEVTRCIFTGSNPDRVLIKNASDSFSVSLKLEKNNLTEAGEGKLVSEIESGFNEYLVNVSEKLKVPVDTITENSLQKQFKSLYQQIMLLSKMNETAIILKVDDAKRWAAQGLKLVTLLASICFVITVTFTYNFTSYFNNRFSKLYNGMREIGSGNFSERLKFEGEDEFYDISLVFNSMAANLEQSNREFVGNTERDYEKDLILEQSLELKRILGQMEGIKERAEDLINKLEHKE